MKTTQARKSPFAIGWIGIRVERIGRARKILEREGWMAVPRSTDERNGFDWVKPLRTRELFERMNWLPLADLGLLGSAYWISDAQWGKNLGMTVKQWENRAIIESAYNRMWPNGRRDATK